MPKRKHVSNYTSVSVNMSMTHIHVLQDISQSLAVIKVIVTDNSSESFVYGCRQIVKHEEGGL